MATTSTTTTSFSFVPAQSLGPFALGASIHEVLHILKSSRGAQNYPAIHLHYSTAEPVRTPVVVTLPENGLRLRFDGADQRLRLIEVMNFQKLKLLYKGSEINKAHKDSDIGPSFKRVYQLMGASYPGEYLPPSANGSLGTYILSWVGVAFSFPLQHHAYSPDKDHVSLLGSNAASPAQHMALFEGNSWHEARKDLFVYYPTTPHSSALSWKQKESLPADIDYANIHLNGIVELVRADPAPPLYIVLNETTPQDLVTELGPPDATHQRDHQLDEPESSAAHASANRRGHPAGSQPSSYSSTGTDTFDADFDSTEPEEDGKDRSRRERFWSYFSHGLDILVGPPTDSVGGGDSTAGQAPRTNSVVTKLVVHGNIPGSYAFNRHRRLRWTLDAAPEISTAREPDMVTSEADFEHLIKPVMLHRFANVWSEEEMSRGKVVNRTWGASPSDSSFFLPDAGEDLVEGGGSEQWLGNTKLYSFPGLDFEVLENGAVSALTVR